MPEERVIEAEFEDDRDEGQGDGKQRQDAECACRQQAKIDGHQHQTEGTVDDAPDAEDQRVLYGLLDFVVDRGAYSRFRLTAVRISMIKVNAAAAMLTYRETKKALGINTNVTTWRPAGTLIARIVQLALKI